MGLQNKHQNALLVFLQSLLHSIEVQHWNYGGMNTYQMYKNLPSYEPPHGKTNNLHRRKQRRRSASR